MARIPDVPISGQRLAGIPGMSMGGRVHASEFEGGARNHQRLANAIQGAGDALGQVGMQMAEERARNWAREMEATEQEDLSRFTDETFTTHTGDQAFKAREHIDKYTKQRMDKAIKSAPSQRARELFEEGMNRYNSHNRILADRHTLAENERWRINSLNARNAQLLQEAARLPGDPAAVMYSLERIRENNAELYHDQPSEVLELKNAESAMVLTETVASNLAAKYGPGAALAFLDVDDIKGQFTAAQFEEKFGQLRGTYQQSKDNAVISNMAVSAAESKVSAADFAKHVYTEYADNPTKAKLALAIFDDYNTRKTNARNTEAVQRKSERWTAFGEGGYNISTLSTEFRNNNPEEFKKMVEFSEWFHKPRAEKIDPDLLFQNELLKKAPTELTAWLNEGNNYDLLMRKMGGDQAEIRRVLEHSRKDGAGGGSSSGSGGSGQSVKLDPSMFFQNGYGTMYSGFFGGPLTYDKKDSTATSRENGFLLRYNRLLADKENELGRKATYQEQEEMAFNLIRDVKLGKVDLDSTIYDERQAAIEAIPEYRVQSESLTMEQAPFHRGEPLFERADPDGVTRKYGKLDVHSTEIATGGVPSSVYEARRRIVAAERTFDRGVARIGDRTISFEPGWNIITMKSGAVEVFDSAWNYRGAVNPPTGQTSDQPFSSPTEKPMAPEPIMDGALRNDMERLESRYGTDRVSREWTGARWIVHIPGEIRIYDGGGRLEGIQPADMLEDM